MTRLACWIVGALVAACTAACGGGPDTGFLRLQQAGARVAYQSYNHDADDERSCLFSGAAGYKAPSSTNPAQVVQFLYQGDEYLPERPAGEPAWPSGSRRLLAGITTMAASGTTQPAGAEPLPTKTQPYGVGRYRLTQRWTSAGPWEEVGALIVEPYQNETRQHWFLFAGSSNPPGAKSVFREPGETNTNVSTQFEYLSAEVYSVDLAAFQASLGFSPITYRRVVLVENNF
jgi:hypothetical protein